MKMGTLSLYEMKSMVSIKPGTFTMGASKGDREAQRNEKPRIRVELTHPFEVGVFQITQTLWASVMGSNPAYTKGTALPVSSVTWIECLVFCNKFSEINGLTPVYDLSTEFEGRLDDAPAPEDDEFGERLAIIEQLSDAVALNPKNNGYRLLTEAEWEYCAGAGQNYLYSGSNVLNDVAWFAENSGQQAHAVGERKANAFGLFDMSGNVAEWCWDRPTLNHLAAEVEFEGYTGVVATNPRASLRSTMVCARGGHFASAAQELRVTARGAYDVLYSDADVGFRIAKNTD